MRITKLGHCCMLIETDGKRILTDPGGSSEFKQNELKDIDLILITHEHGDHLHIDSLKTVLTNNPSAKIVTNTSVGELIGKENIKFEKIENRENESFDGLLIEGFGEEHHEIYNEFGLVQNTGYFIGEKFFYPGDAFTNPGKQVELLALPVVGPWLDIKEAVDYAKELKPKKAFPVHDGMLKHTGPFHAVPKILLEPEGIEFINTEEIPYIQL